MDVVRMVAMQMHFRVWILDFLCFVKDGFGPSVGDQLKSRQVRTSATISEASTSFAFTQPSTNLKRFTCTS
jgi:hypothetical protein